MKWISDPTRRFLRRPLYEAAEMEFECGQLIEKYFEERAISREYPLTTEHLSRLLESRTARCDFGRDLSSFGEDVEGVTLFSNNAKPVVYISHNLREPSLYRRRRMTIAHELGHVHFHNVLFKTEQTLELFLDMSKIGPTCCKRSTISSGGDWMEWQAAFAGGAILMPFLALKPFVADTLEKYGARSPIKTDSPIARELVGLVSSHFETSQDAARVRLLQRGFLEASNATLLNLSS